MTTGASPADMTLIMVCVSTRQTVQRETIVRVTGDVKSETVDDRLQPSIQEDRRSGVGRGGVPEMSTELMVKFHNASQLTIAHPAVAELGAGAGRIDHRFDQQVAEENSVRDQDHREDCPAEQGL